MKAEGYDIAQTVDDLWRFTTEQLRSISRFRLVGYGLLVLAVFDVVDSLIPPQPGNPGWVVQTIGSFVERAPVPLLAMALIFFGENFERKPIGTIVTKILSWFCLLLAVFFLGLAPLGVLKTVEINKRTAEQISAQSKQQLDQLKKVEDQLKTGTAQDIKVLANQLSSLGLQVNTQNPEEVRKQILDRMTPAKQQLQTQANAYQSNQQLLLFKNAGKWVLGALVSSFLYFSLWRGSRWARR